MNLKGIINKIVQNEFFIKYSDFSDNEKNKAVRERAIMESIMCMFHFEKWNKNTKKIAQFLNDNASKDEFDVLNSNITRLCNVITDQTKILFNSKDCFIWLTLFNKFTSYGMDDAKFGEFLYAFVNELKDKPVDGKLFYTADEKGSTKDKSVIVDKLHILETLMKEFLHIEEVESITPESFIAEMVDMPIETIKEEMDCYEETLNGLEDNTIRDGSKLLDVANRLSLLAMVAYSYKNDVNLDDWLEEYARNNNTYNINQKQNYFQMLNNLKQYQRRMGVI